MVFFDKRLVSTASSETTASADSSDDSSSTNSFIKSNRNTVLESALKEVRQHGWTEDAIAAGVVSAKLPPSMTGMISASDLVAHVMESGNRHLEEALKAKEWDEHPSRSQRLVFCLRLSLEYICPYVETNRWHEAMALGAMPPNNITITAKQLNDMITIISNSVPLGPLERAAVGAVYAATELHLLADKSNGYQDTWKFLEERVGEVELVSNLTSSDKLVSSDAAVAASAVAFSLGGAVLSLAQPAARGAVSALAGTVVPQIATFMQPTPRASKAAGTRPSDYNVANNDLPPFPNTGASAETTKQ